MAVIPIIVKQGTAAQAEEANEILKVGEWGYETDTFKLKIGRGLNWIDTPYLSVPDSWEALTGHPLDNELLDEILKTLPDTMSGWDISPTSGKIGQTDSLGLVVRKIRSSLATFSYAITFPLTTEALNIDFAPKALTITKIARPVAVIATVEYSKNGAAYVVVPGSGVVNIPLGAGDLMNWKVTYQAGHNSGAINIEGAYS
jgi:hypothetical protein